MAATQWETCSADALLREFFAQDDLSRLAEGAGALLGCPLLVLDDTFHVAAHHLPLGFSDAVFQASVRSGEITYEAGAIISRSPALSAGAADCVKLADSPYRRRFAPLVSAGVRLGYLICVDTDGHLERIPAQTWNTVEQILAKQLNISPTQLSYVTNSNEGEGLLFYGNVIIPFVDRFPKNRLYQLLTTRPEETGDQA